MKVSQRHAVLAAGLLSLCSGLTSSLTAQRPSADVPRILVATFKSDDRTAGVEAGDAIRQRVTQEVPVRQLWVISKNDINNTLEASGYRPDSALSANDLKELAKLLRADEIVDGTVTKTPNGVRVEPRLMLSRDVALAQPLPPVDAKNPGDAAKQVERELSDARKQLEANTKCTNDLRAGKFREAIDDASKGIITYPQATLARLCLMSAYQGMKAALDTSAKTAADSARRVALNDSVLTVANAILKIDPKSNLALRNAVAAYQFKADTARAIQTSILLYRADPSNQQLIQTIINEIARMGKPETALPLIDDLLKDNPGDPQLLRTKWLLLLAASKWKEALAAGEEYAKADTSAITQDFFTRQLAAAAADSQPQLAAQIAARAVQRFPSDASLATIYAQTLRKAGQLQQAIAAARKAVQLDPKNQNAWLLVAVTQGDLNQPDSVIATAKQAIAAGMDKATFGSLILQQANNAFKNANTTKNVGDWERTLSLSQLADSLSPANTSKFFIGVSSFQIGIDALQAAQREKSCAAAKKAEDMFALTQINMPAGGAVDKQTAQTVLGYVQQYGDAIPKMKKAYCK